MEVVEQMQQISIDTTPFIRYMPNEKAYIDNQGINIEMCKELGVPAQNIHPSVYDTKKSSIHVLAIVMINKQANTLPLDILNKPKQSSLGYFVFHEDDYLN